MHALILMIDKINFPSLKECLLAVGSKHNGRTLRVIGSHKKEENYTTKHKSDMTSFLVGIVPYGTSCLRLVTYIVVKWSWN